MHTSMSSSAPVLFAAQCRAGRALVEWSAEKLAQEAQVDLQVLVEFEARFRRPDGATLGRLRGALEAAGIVFIDENGGGAGARLKLNRKDVRALNRWEGEGGAVQEDI